MKRNNIDGIRIRSRAETPKKREAAPVRVVEHTHTKPVKRVVKKKQRHESVVHTPYTYHHKPRNLKSWLKIVRIVAPITFGIVASIIAINQLDSARIRIHPHKDLLTIDSSTTLKKTAGVGELDFAVIAITDTAEVPLEADTQVPVNKYASGTIRIFNEYSTAPQRLSPSTRFKSVDGKVFMISDEAELVIPGMTDDGPGEVTAVVYASEPGEEYNIDATDFSIPGFAELGLDDKYSNIYALSTEAFTGGFVGTKPAISEELQLTYKQQLEDELVETLSNRLQTDKTYEMSVINNTSSIELKDVEFTSKEDGTQGVLSVSGTLYALLVSKERLGMYLAQQQLGTADNEKVLLDETSTVAVRYNGESIDYENVSSIPVTISGQALFVWQPNTEIITAALSGAKKASIPYIADSIRSIGKINVKNHPRWQSTLPDTKEAIKLSIIND